MTNVVGLCTWFSMRFITYKCPKANPGDEIHKFIMIFVTHLTRVMVGDGLTEA